MLQMPGFIVVTYVENHCLWADFLNQEKYLNILVQQLARLRRKAV